MKKKLNEWRYISKLLFLRNDNSDLLWCIIGTCSATVIVSGKEYGYPSSNPR